MSFFSPGLFRLLLATLVVLQHSGVLEIGITAVNIFFILSGYWISRMWRCEYQKCQPAYPTFVVSRLWRVAPIYYACWVCSAIALFLFPSQWAHVQPHININWLTRSLAIVGFSKDPLWLGQAWSLDIEVEFYLLAPLFLMGMAVAAKKGRAVSTSVAGALLAVSLLLLCSVPGYLPRYLIFFVAGIFIDCFDFKSSRNLALLALGGGIGVSVLMAWYSPVRIPDSPGSCLMGMPGLQRHLPSIAALVMVPFAAYTFRQKDCALDRYFGNLSYPVYLFHRIPPSILDKTSRWSEGRIGRVQFLLLTWGLVALGSMCIHRYIDRPMERRRKRFVAGRKATPSPVCVGLTPLQKSPETL